jgi:hypothetical protein
MKAAAAGGISDAAALEEWNRQVEAQNWKRTVSKPMLQQRIRLVETAKLPSVVRWQIQWGAQGPVVGPVGKWISETIRNMYTSEYMMVQSAALYAQPKAEGGYCPAYDTRLIRDVWMRSGQAKERVMAAKFMWALCACNELFHKRFERHETGECSVCTGHCETPWHVLGECADIEAVAARGRWVRRMRKVLEAAGERVGRKKGCLDASVVTALVKLWGWSEEGGSIPEWKVGESGPPGFADGMAGVDVEIKGMLIGVAKTGSWAVWNGVFERSWIKLLRAAGLNYHRARKVTGQLAAAISEERVLVAKVRHEREGRAGKEERDRRSEEANAGIHRWIRQNGSSVSEEYLLGCSLRQRLKWLRTQQIKDERRQVQAAQRLLRRDTRRWQEWRDMRWIGGRPGALPQPTIEQVMRGGPVKGVAVSAER